jgi:hypothetical protein
MFRLFAALLPLIGFAAPLAAAERGRLIEYERIGTPDGRRARAGKGGATGRAASTKGPSTRKTPGPRGFRRFSGGCWRRIEANAPLPLGRGWGWGFPLR